MLEGKNYVLNSNSPQHLQKELAGRLSQLKGPGLLSITAVQTTLTNSVTNMRKKMRSDLLSVAYLSAKP